MYWAASLAEITKSPNKLACQDKRAFPEDDMFNIYLLDEIAAERNDDGMKLFSLNYIK